MDKWKNCVPSAGKPMSIKFLVLGGGGYFGFFGGGGGGADFIFMSARILLRKTQFSRGTMQETAGSCKRGFRAQESIIKSANVLT